jgi:hypothetical protein
MENPVLDRSWKLASFVSGISHPLYLAPLAILAVSLRVSSRLSAGFYWWGLYLVFSTFLPIADLIWRRKTGRISDWHISERSERIWPLVFGIFYAAAGFAVFRLLAAPLILQASLLAGLAVSAVVLGITSFWKISLHLLGNASLLLILFLAFEVALFSAVTALMVLYLVAVALARLRLGAHTVPQVIAGAFLGGGLTWLIFWAMGAIP